MRIKIADKPVRQNVELILKILRRVKEKSAQEPLSSEKIFKAWINRATGQFLFSDTLSESQFLGKQDWKPVELSYLYNSETGDIAFLLEEVEVKQRGFYSSDLAPEAFHIIQGTLKVINDLCRQIKSLTSLDAKISAIAQVAIDAITPRQDKRILIDAWHFVDRMGAEDLLLNKPVGTYLFRKDSYADILEQQLKKQHRKKVRCFTLTYAGSNLVICDLTLVEVDGAWQVYNDDPSLQQAACSELQELLGKFKEKLKYPLYP